MQLLETLPLGGKRQLMLVQCGTEQFLVGGGLESVETIVKLAGTTDTLRQQDDLCG
jgi:flagellar biogenesis protein FliO